MNKNKLFATLVLLISFVLLSGCIGTNNIEKDFSFEDGLDDWKINGTDLRDPSGNGEQNWSITISNGSEYSQYPGIEINATDGEDMVKYYLNNKNDAGKIWIEKEFDLKQNTKYSINLSFDFGTTDFGINQWTIIAGPYDDTGVENLPYQGKTGKEEQGFEWLEKNYTFKINTDEDGKTKLLIGIWGTWETPRTYFLDNVSLEISER